MQIQLHYKFAGLNFYLLTRDDLQHRDKVYEREMKFLAGVVGLVKDVPMMDKFTAEMTYNSGLDPDNAWMVLKMFVDSCRHHRLLKDDTKKEYMGITVKPDESLPNNSYNITITPMS